MEKRAEELKKEEEEILKIAERISGVSMSEDSPSEKTNRNLMLNNLLSNFEKTKQVAKQDNEREEHPIPDKEDIRTQTPEKDLASARDNSGTPAKASASMRDNHGTSKTKDKVQEEEEKVPLLALDKSESKEKPLTPDQVFSSLSRNF